MKLDLDRIRVMIATRRDKIAFDYDIEDPSQDPEVFARQVVESFKQPCRPNMLHRSVDDQEVFKAAVWAIGSSATVWTGFRRRERQRAETLRGYDPVAVDEALTAGDVAVDDIAACLTSQYRRRDGVAIARWARMLAASPGYYEVIRDVGTIIRELHTDGELPDEKLMLCLVCYFSNPLARWPGESKLSDRVERSRLCSDDSPACFTHWRASSCATLAGPGSNPTVMSCACSTSGSVPS